MSIPRMPVAALAVSAAAIAAIAAFEGYRSRAYDDGGGVWTVGFGTTRHADGRLVRPGDSIEPVRAVQRLAADASATAREVARCIGQVPLAQHEFDAYVSLAYNIGTGAFCRSTVVRRLRQDPPDYAGACEAIRLWTRSGDQVLPGLVARREAEARWCLTGVPPGERQAAQPPAAAPFPEAAR